MKKHLLVEVDWMSNEATISEVDETGNGIIVLRGKLGGCGFLSKADQDTRIGVLRRLVLDNSPDSIDGTD